MSSIYKDSGAVSGNYYSCQFAMFSNYKNRISKVKVLKVMIKFYLNILNKLIYNNTYKVQNFLIFKLIVYQSKEYY